ncbi:GNAT family N-acetyltransferase [Bacillus sp. SD075]|uniref:GNAT family N-acetyltransferase n=1 Tax=Bacillus sp. SD075 TaxID=2781732 RepID=UPI001A978478|nr:GNAT family N-acetyltransferase [Bacillus sp. SD075]MBO0998129.1 GNAT family N-acetyltransferase [Bacillus sp. SD075]
MIFRTIDTDKGKDIIVKFRKGSYVVSFGDENIYLQRMRERVRKFPDAQVIIEKVREPIGQKELQIREYEGIEIGYVNLFYLMPDYRSKGLGKELVRFAENFFRQFNVSEYQLRVS